MIATNTDTIIIASIASLLVYYGAWRRLVFECREGIENARKQPITFGERGGELYGRLGAAELNFMRIFIERAVSRCILR